MAVYTTVCLYKVKNEEYTRTALGILTCAAVGIVVTEVTLY